MATTADYLNKLIKQKNTLADNLVTKGVTATHDETLETLVPKVLEIRNETISESQKMGYITDGLICHYSADNEHFSGGYRINDLSGNSNTGLFFNDSNYNTIVNNTGNYISMKDYYINMGEHNYQNITLEYTCKVITTSTSLVGLITNFEQGGYGLNMTNQIVYAQAYINDSYMQVYDSNSISSDIVHYAMSYDGSNLKLFKNGVLENSIIKSGEIIPPNLNSVLMINGDPTNALASKNDSFFDINFYAARLYNRALSDSEILHNFNCDNIIFNIVNNDI